MTSGSLAIPRQRLSNDERERRVDEAVQRFAGNVIGLDYVDAKPLLL